MFPSTTPPSLSTQLLTVAILTLQRQLAHNRVNTVEKSSPSNLEVDYIVVGGGTAGCIVAARLSDSNLQTSVLLLEAGGPMTVTREMTGLVDFSSQVWPYSIVQSNRSSLAFTQLFLPYGKVLGGSSTISFNYYNRGNGLVYDSWARQFGAQGWSAQEVLPYFRMSENNTDFEVVKARPWIHGTEGPVEVSTTPDPDPFLLQWRSIVHKAGWPLADFGDLDPNAQFGVTIPQVTQSVANWTRISSASAYIEGRGGRRNLRVELNARVTKVLFFGKAAVGVQFMKNGQIFQAFSRREVILSAGTFNTPQLLMLSGVGPRKHLEKFRIPVIADLPAVGSTLISHPNMLLDFRLLNRSLVNDPYPVGSEQTTIGSLYDFLAKGQGPLRQSPSVMVYFGTEINGNRLWPDVFAYSGGPALYAALSNPVNLQIFKPDVREQWRSYYQALAPTEKTTNAFTIFLLVRPKSSGNVRLASADPLQLPQIDLGYFSSTQDLAAIVRGLAMGFELVEQSSEAQQLLSYSALPVPGCNFCEDGRPLSKCPSYLVCLARTVTFSDGHDCCTVRMGSSLVDNSSYVLDERLRVRTLQRLRVIDASAMPAIPNGNTLAPTMMVGERGAVLVIEDNK